MLLLFLFSGVVFEKSPFLFLNLNFLVVLTVFIFVIYLPAVYFWSRLLYNNWKYELVEKGIKVERGVVAKSYTTIPYKRIQNIDIHRDITERILGLSNLHIQTAGETGGSEANLPGLGPSNAEQLREKLSRRVNNKELEL